MSGSPTHTPTLTAPLNSAHSLTCLGRTHPSSLLQIGVHPIRDAPQRTPQSSPAATRTDTEGKRKIAENKGQRPRALNLAFQLPRHGARTRSGASQCHAATVWQPDSGSWLGSLHLQGKSGSFFFFFFGNCFQNRFHVVPK